MILVRRKRKILAAFVILSTKRSRRKIWTNDWILRRHENCAYHKLLKELRNEDPSQFLNFIRMSTKFFDELVNLVEVLIGKENMPMRPSISAAESCPFTG